MADKSLAIPRLGLLLAKIRDELRQFLDACQCAISGEGNVNWRGFCLELPDPGNGGTISFPKETPHVTLSNFAIYRFNIPVSKTDIDTAARCLEDFDLPHDAKRLRDEFQHLNDAFCSLGEWIQHADGVRTNRKFYAQACAAALWEHVNQLIGTIKVMPPPPAATLDEGEGKGGAGPAVMLAEAPDTRVADLDFQRKFMVMAVAEARKCKPEDGRVHPKVGVVVVKGGAVLATAYRGELRAGDHAEFTALEKKLPDAVVAGATVYTTLEPCTSRKHPKLPCASRLIERKVKRVVIGMHDPNRTVYGGGWARLQEAGIVTADFESDLKEEIKEMNRDFIRSQAEAGRKQGAKEGEG
jgi:pyrimidine deaminase RibD-like protein